jgi:hypothetical protein
MSVDDDDLGCCFFNGAKFLLGVPIALSGFYEPIFDAFASSETRPSSRGATDARSAPATG